jgi:hypothetical protein
MVAVISGKLCKLYGGIIHSLFIINLPVHVVSGQPPLLGAAVRAVLAGEYSAAQRIIGDYSELFGFCKGQDLNLCLTLDQILHGLNAVKGDPAVAGGYTQRLGNLPGSKVADTGISDFSLGNHIIQSPQGFFEGGLLVKPV